MLSGRSPFLTHRPKDDSAANIMKRIKSGDFRMESSSNEQYSSVWKVVSSPAKTLVRGLLTVDPKKRLTLDDLFNSPWIKLGEGASLRSSNSPSLLSPSVLKSGPLLAERNLMQTYNAFHRATREGGLGHMTLGSKPIHKSKSKMTGLSSMGLTGAANKNCSTSSSVSNCSSLPSSHHSSLSLSPTKTSLNSARAAAANPWFFPASIAAAMLTSSTSSTAKP